MSYQMIDKQFNGDRFEWAEYLPAPEQPRLLRAVQYYADGYFDVLNGTEERLITHLTGRYGEEMAREIVAAMNN